MGKLKSKLRYHLLHLYRLRYRRSRTSAPRPARLCFRTPNLSGVFHRRRGRCAEEAEQCLRLGRRFPLAFCDERRRHQPQRAAHFRYCVKAIQSEVALHFSQGSKASKNDLRHHHKWCLRKLWMERMEANLEAGGRTGPGESHSHRHSRSQQSEHRFHRTGEDAFDYSTFRRAYWYSKAHSSSRPYNKHHRAWRQRAKRIQWNRPQEYALKRADILRKRTGLAFFTWQESPSARRLQGVEGRGGSGGIARSGLGLQSLRLASPCRPTSDKPALALHRHALRSHMSLPTAAPTSLFARGFSTSQCRHGVHFLLPLATALKSTEALHVLVWVTRISLTLLPLSIRSKAIFALRERQIRDPSSLTASIFSRLAAACYAGELTRPSGFLSRWNAMIGLPLLLLSPFILLGLVAFASLERTPVTGRWRLVMLSPAEESELVEGILSIGRTAQPATTAQVHLGETQPVAPEGTSLDWVAILRQVLELPDEGVDPVTGRRMLLGGVVLDHRDWRVRWTEAVLRALEKGVVEGLTREGSGAKGEGEALRPPPSKFPLEGRAVAPCQPGWKDELIVSKHFEGSTNSNAAQLQVEYDILVIDRDENNAFSFGFAPEHHNLEHHGRRGVIVVYTGFLKQVLGETASPSQAPPTTSRPSSGRLASFFSLPTTAATPATTTEPDPIASYFAPTTLPTQEQCKSLAVLLSHEAAHLILSHTLESYASTNLLMPHLSRLASDVLRTLLYPVTAILGPFINDAVGKSLSEGAKAGFGLFGNAANSCESRKLESEADLVALRLLAGSGIDPRFALDFWEDRLSSSPNPSTTTSTGSTTLPFNHVNTVRHHSHNNATEQSVGLLDGYMRTHPVDQERLERIRQELNDWEEWNQARRQGTRLA
ncbi:uncharacterized protein JCM15063_005086 [Sporobolomyces koalae]|uniref:uncharacterized protein n=1 Tax=Sporobolomyces koalae TaxID=500713 RepID=UPI003182B761